jgi:hypothetical protein
MKTFLEILKAPDRLKEKNHKKRASMFELTNFLRLTSPPRKKTH